MPNVLIVDDSPTIRLLVRAILESDPELRVIGEAADGYQAIDLCHALDPDVVTMDIRMPRLDGFRATRRIMSTAPRPVIVLTSSHSDQELGISFRAIEAGALMVLGKPKGLPDVDPEARKLVAQIKAMAGLKMVRRIQQYGGGPPQVPSLTLSEEIDDGVGRPVEIIGIGCSTGGPPALHTILSAGLLDVPVAVVQHISPGFVPSLARWLDQATPWRVRVAKEGEQPASRTVYLAPDGVHLEISPEHRFTLCPGAGVDGHRPSITRFFESLARTCGEYAVGVLLTGMGQDGAAGLALMHEAGSYTLTQDEGTSVVHAMPRAAIEAGAVDEVLPLPRIGRRLREVVDNCDHWGRLRSAESRLL